ncbi:DUF6160 family protein [Marinobacter halotolerans]|uniref:DUF6160 family protein n=1 Tax=Marinobacter halotolerans TaxID=1569211 RepID=UPI00124487EC|nr:DUF6160 family protein [Marinobacter halotolerans]
MKGLKKIALCSAVALAPFAANADLKALNDSAMSDVTGQAGVTIDLSANVSIGEIAYEDQGFLAISDVTLGGAAPGSALDDIRLTIDVAGADPQDDLGVAALGATYLGGAGFNVSNVNETDQAVSDGDLVIALRSQSGAPVDFGLSIGEVSLNKSANGADLGSFSGSADQGTVLVSNLNITGALGPIDIVVQEESNAMNINAYFNAAGDLTMPFIGTSMGFELHNRRGDSSVTGPAGTPLEGVSFAHAQVDVGVAEDYFAADQDALTVNVQDFSGDLDLTSITMGNGVSIGSVYMTDLAITADMTIYGH